jgi:hypothetical protein
LLAALGRVASPMAGKGSLTNQLVMAFKRKEKSAAVEQAKARLAGMKEIDKKKARVIDYGDEGSPCTSVTVEARILKVEKDMETYNGLLAQADALGNTIDKGEKDLNEDAARVLLGARSKFGRDGSEVEQLGGTRQSETAKRTVKAVVAK